MWPALVALLQAALSVAPELVKDVEALIADVKNAPADTPMTPELRAEMDPLEAKLEALRKK